MTRTDVGPLDDVEVGQDVPLLVDDEARAGARRGLVAEEALALRLGGDVDDALVHVGVDEDVVPLLGVEVLEHVLGRGGGAPDRGLDRRDGPARVGLDAARERAAAPGLAVPAPGIWATGGWRLSPRRPPKRRTTRSSVSATVAACAASVRPSDFLPDSCE